MPRTEDFRIGITPFYFAYRAGQRLVDDGGWTAALRDDESSRHCVFLPVEMLALHSQVSVTGATGSAEMPQPTTIGVLPLTRLKRSMTSWLIIRTQPDDIAWPMVHHSGEPWTR